MSGDLVFQSASLFVKKLSSSQEVGQHATPSADRVIRIGWCIGNVVAAEVILGFLESALSLRVSDEAGKEVECPLNFRRVNCFVSTEYTLVQMDDRATDRSIGFGR